MGAAPHGRFCEIATIKLFEKRYALPRVGATTLSVTITNRDFKRARPRGLRLDVGRSPEFGVGVAVGLSLSLFVLLWQNDREKHSASEAATTSSHQPRPAVAAAGAGEVAQSYDFYEMLPKFEVVVPEKE